MLRKLRLKQKNGFLVKKRVLIWNKILQKIDRVLKYTLSVQNKDKYKEDYKINIRARVKNIIPSLF